MPEALQYKMIRIHSPRELGQALRAARKNLQLTQAQLALVAGVGVRFIVDAEAGKPTLRLENVLRVVDVLGGELVVIGLPLRDEAASKMDSEDKQR